MGARAVAGLWAGLVAGLWVGQHLWGVLSTVPGFGFAVPVPWLRTGRPTSICNIGFNSGLYMYVMLYCEGKLSGKSPK